MNGYEKVLNMHSDHCMIVSFLSGVNFYRIQSYAFCELFSLVEEVERVCTVNELLTALLVLLSGCSAQERFRALYFERMSFLVSAALIKLGLIRQVWEVFCLSRLNLQLVS